MPEPFINNGPNSYDFRTSELPAGNGHGTASGLAKLFGILSTGCKRNNNTLMREDSNQIGYSCVCNKQQKNKNLYKTSNLLTKALYKAIS